jgi:hypothetical protein
VLTETARLLLIMKDGQMHKNDSGARAKASPAGRKVEKVG